MATIWVTGASSGLGAGLAREMSGRGHAVGLMARRVDRLEALRDDIVAKGGRVALAPCDVTDLASVEAAANALRAELGVPDVLVANAGVEGQMKEPVIDLGAIRHTFDVNVFGAIQVAQQVLPDMLERRSGHLVVVSSVAATRGLPKSATYSASKAAISTFWESLRVDLQGTGVACTTIHPGFVRTAMTEGQGFTMPWLLEPEQAAVLMADAIEKRKRTLTFPWQMRWLERAMRVLPNAVFDRAARRLDTR